MSRENNDVVKAIIQEMQGTIDRLRSEAQKLKYDLDQYSTKIDVLILERDAALLREHQAKLSAASARSELAKLHEYIVELEVKLERR